MRRERGLEARCSIVRKVTEKRLGSTRWFVSLIISPFPKQRRIPKNIATREILLQGPRVISRRPANRERCNGSILSARCQAAAPIARTQQTPDLNLIDPPFPASAAESALMYPSSTAIGPFEPCERHHPSRCSQADEEKARKVASSIDATEGTHTRRLEP